MRTTKWAPLGLASVLALTSVAALSAQEQEKQQDYSQEKEITVQLAAVQNSNASGTAVVRFTGDPADPAAGEKVEIRYDLSALEPSTSYTAVIHEGACATGTTRIADLGSVESDENGAIQETVEVESRDAIAVLSGERDRAMETREEQEPQEMSREGTRHLQLQVNGQAVACGNFEPGS